MVKRKRTKLHIKGRKFGGSDVSVRLDGALYKHCRVISYQFDHEQVPLYEFGRVAGFEYRGTEGKVSFQTENGTVITVETSTRRGAGLDFRWEE